MTKNDTETEAPAATAKLSLPTLTTMVVGSMVGAGVFSLPRRFASWSTRSAPGARSSSASG
jgi:arginine:ornithine antiporter/lysine permease